MVSSVSVNCKHICQALLQTAVQYQSLHPGFLGQLRNLGGGWRVLLFSTVECSAIISGVQILMCVS